MEQLELRHIACYLPYGLMDQSGDEIVSLSKSGEIETLFRGHLVNYRKIDEIKPLLRPLSQLTQEITHNGEKIVASLEIHKRFGYDIASSWGYRHVKPINYPYQIVELLISWHFDVFGLIEKGLAIEKT